jgi:tetratricopeptide (TPR) repeat protein
LQTDKSLALEYNYRLGRAYQYLSKNADAIYHLTKAIDLGKKSYMSCNAALQIAGMYEEMDRNALAKVFYERCLAIDSDEYKTSLHQKAKAGLSRLKKGQ